MSYTIPTQMGLDCPCIGPTMCVGQYVYACDTAYSLPILAEHTGTYTLRYWLGGKWFSAPIDVVDGEPITIPSSALPDRQSAIQFILNDTENQRVTTGDDPIYDTFLIKFAR